MRMRQVLAVILCMFIIPISTSYLQNYTIDVQSNSQIAETYMDHDFISILGNDDFLSQAVNEGWQGSGTRENPIIIEGYRIQMSRHLFRVVNTNLHFIFTDCYLDGIDGTWCGLYLANVTNGVIRNTIVRNSAISFHMVEIFNCTMMNNELHDNYNDGIVLELACKGNNITSNLIYDNDENGILLDFGCENNLVMHNEIYDNGGNGIYIWPDSATLSATRNWIKNNNVSRHSVGISIQGHENYVSENTIINSYSAGILCGGEQNAIINNTIRDGRRDGIKLYSYANNIFVSSNSIQNNTNRGIIISSTCDNNSVIHNDLIKNNVTCQMWDDGENNFFSNNYYSSWNAPDDNNDGKVDIPYPIGGDAASLDLYPSSLPNCVTPVWYTYSLVTGSTIVESSEENYDFEIRMLALVIIVACGIVILGLRSRHLR